MIHDRFGPGHRETHAIACEGLTPLRDLARAVRLPLPGLRCWADGKPAELADEVEAGALVEFQPVPGDPGTAFLIASLVLTVASLALSFIMRPKGPKTPDSENVEEARRISGLRNEARLFEPLPISYGEAVRMTPPLAANWRTDPAPETEFRVGPPSEPLRARRGAIQGFVTWGPDPDALEITDRKLGETAFESLEGAEVALLDSGESAGFPNVVDDPVGATLVFRRAPTGSTPATIGAAIVATPNALGHATRTSQPNAQRIEVDLLFPAGLRRLNAKGGGARRPAFVCYHVRPTGDPIPSSGFKFRQIVSTTQQPFFVTLDVDLHDPGVQADFGVQPGDTVDVTVALFGGTPGQSSEDFTTDEGGSGANTSLGTGDASWVSLKTTLPGVAITETGIAAERFRLIADNNIKGLPDEYNGLVSRKVRDIEENEGVYSFTSEKIISSNPALIAADILTNAGVNALAVADSRLDLEEFFGWAEFCTDRELTFKAVLQGESVLTALQKVARAGFATIDLGAAKIRPIIKRKVAVPSRVVSPRNARITTEREWNTARPIDALRINFVNEATGFRQDEAWLFLGGATRETAQVWETVAAPDGVTTPDAARRLALLETVLERSARAERWTIELPAEGLLLRAGDAVRLNYPKFGLGLGAGRVLSVEGDTFLLDEPIEVPEGEDPLVAEVDGAVLSLEALEPGRHQEFTLAESSELVRPGIMLAVGMGTRAAADLFVESWELRDLGLVELRAAPLANDVFDAVDEMELPEFEPLTAGDSSYLGRRPAPPSITLVRIAEEEEGNRILTAAIQPGHSAAGQYAPTITLRVTLLPREFDPDTGDAVDHPALVSADLPAAPQVVKLDFLDSASAGLLTVEAISPEGLIASATAPVSLLPSTVPAPTNLVWDVTPALLGQPAPRLVFSWVPGGGTGAVYHVRYRRDGLPWASLQTSAPTFSLPAVAGRYDVEIRANVGPATSPALRAEDLVVTLEGARPLTKPGPARVMAGERGAGAFWVGPDLRIEWPASNPSHTYELQFAAIDETTNERVAIAGVLPSNGPAFTFDFATNKLANLISGRANAARALTVDIRAVNSLGQRSPWRRSLFLQPLDGIFGLRAQFQSNVTLYALPDEPLRALIAWRESTPPHASLDPRLHAIGLWVADTESGLDAKIATQAPIQQVSEAQFPSRAIFELLIRAVDAKFFRLTTGQEVTDLTDFWYSLAYTDSFPDGRWRAAARTHYEDWP